MKEIESTLPSKVQNRETEVTMKEETQTQAADGKEAPNRPQLLHVDEALQPSLLPHIQELMVIIDAAQAKGGVDVSIQDWFAVSNAMRHFAPSLDLGLSNMKLLFSNDNEPLGFLESILDKCAQKGAISRRDSVQVFTRLISIKTILNQRQPQQSG